MRTLSITAVCFALLLAGCSEAPKKEAKKEEPKKAPEAITGKNAFYKVYVTARSWAPDVQCLRVSSIPLNDLQAGPGKAGAWQVEVVSPSKGRKKTFTWSAIEEPGNLHEGVFAGTEDSYRPGGNDRPFLIAALKTDTDAALKTAEEKSKEYMAKNPKMPINFLLEINMKHQEPSWRVIWGESVGTSGHSIFVNATTGNYMETRH